MCGKQGGFEEKEGLKCHREGGKADSQGTLVICGVVPRALLRFMDRNAQLKPVSPVVWFCSATFSQSGAGTEKSGLNRAGAAGS